MPKRLVMKKPTAEEIEQLNLVAETYCNSHRLLVERGIDPDMSLAGLAAAAASLVEDLHGPEMVGSWFRAQLENVEAVVRKQSH